MIIKILNNGLQRHRLWFALVCILIVIIIKLINASKIY